MNSPRFEAFLVRLYTDSHLRVRFLAEPLQIARAAGLTNSECAALLEIDREGLIIAGESYTAKRQRLYQNRRAQLVKNCWKVIVAIAVATVFTIAVAFLLSVLQRLLFLEIPWFS